MVSRRSLVLGGWSLVAASFCMLAAATHARAAVPNSFGPEMFGISTGGAIQNEDAATLARDLDVIAEAGARWVRIDINWAQIQSRGPSSYDWGAIDRVVQGATARGMKVLGIIAYTPSWARPAGASHTYGPDPSTYANFAAKAVEHYSAMGVHAYEVWNEPNWQNFWTPRPDPAAYTRLLKAAYPAIKGADPQATVLTGGTAPAPTDGTNYAPAEFLKAIYANGGGGSFDAVSHHPYGFPSFPGESHEWSAWHQMYGTNPSLRSVMIANGDGGKKIWGTEFGAPTNGHVHAFSEDSHAEMITRAYALWKTYDWAGPLFIYQHRDLGTSTDSGENFFGLLRHDFSPKPAYAAYQDAVADWDQLSDPSGTGGATGSGDAAAGSGTTAIKVTVKRRRGGGRVRGIVSTTGISTRSKRAVGKLELTLHRRAENGWRRAARARTVRLMVRGSFAKPLSAFQQRALRAGIYRVHARYLGSRDAPPSASRSRVFKLRA
jgi:hypothetical protein